MSGNEIKTIRISDPQYPALLKEIHKAPELLYYRGVWVRPDEQCLAVVGTRHPTYYGEQVTPGLVEELARGGLTIVSGLAVGVDTMAHRAALKAGGRTIAVLGSGMDHESFFPQENVRLMEEIVASGGLVISEFPVGTPALKQNFPQRNRIISGLSRGVLVIEGPPRSGSLITTRYAVEQNRDVFALPGPINSVYSLGPNFLIQQGARMVLKAQDIFDELGIVPAKITLDTHHDGPDYDESGEASDDPVEGAVGRHPIHIDDIIRKSQMLAHIVSAKLSALEIEGRIKHIGAGRYVRV